MIRIEATKTAVVMECEEALTPESLMFVGRSAAQLATAVVPLLSHYPPHLMAAEAKQGDQHA